MFGEDLESPRMPSVSNHDLPRIACVHSTRLPSLQPWTTHSSTSPSPIQLPTPTSLPGTPQEDSIYSSPHVRIRKQPSLETLLAVGLGEDFDQLSLGHGDILDLTGSLETGLAPEVDHKGHVSAPSPRNRSRS